MIEKLEFTEEKGSQGAHDLTLYALSTCGFCKKAINFLKEHDLGFRYVFLDKINPMVKQTVKSELKQQYESLPVFPILVIDNERAISGYSEEKWKQMLDVE
ncbi:MAG: glutaredoxin family protein [bacterium]